MSARGGSAQQDGSPTDRLLPLLLGKDSTLAPWHWELDQGWNVRLAVCLAVCVGCVLLP
jgi:hypothetical protein